MRPGTRELTLRDHRVVEFVYRGGGPGMNKGPVF
jgi:hypothetical protein